MILYLSIPISNKDEATQRRHAKMWQRYFESLNHSVINPWDIGDQLNQFHKDAQKSKPEYSEYMAEDLEALGICDTIFMCNGWSESNGCILEAKIASQVYGLKFIYERTFLI